MQKYHAITASEIIGNTPLNDIGEKNERSYFKISNESFAEKVIAALDASELKWSGSKLDGKTTITVNIADEEAFKNLRSEVQKLEQNEKAPAEKNNKVKPAANAPMR